LNNQRLAERTTQQLDPQQRQGKAPSLYLQNSTHREKVNTRWEYGGNPNPAFKRLMAFLFKPKKEAQEAIENN